MSFHLRPVPDTSPSPSSTASASPTDDPNAPSRPRRPLSPTSLRDVDLTHSTDPNSRKYPAPPTGHDLMALFPPRPPTNLGNRPEPTSRYFQPQERSFFAKPGKEIVRIEFDLLSESAIGVASSKTSSRVYSSPSMQASSAVSYPRTHNAMFPQMPPHPAPSNPNHSASARPPPVLDAAVKKDLGPSDDYRDPDDDTWRSPLQFHERRRAGKHTRRVIVRT